MRLMRGNSESYPVVDNRINKIYFFKCSVSADLFGASPNSDGSPLPTPGGGKWIPLDGLKSLGNSGLGYDEADALKQIQIWGCHWFSSEGTTEIFWGPQGPPKTS